MKKVYLGALFLFACALAFGQNAMVQVIHNSPTPGTSAGPVVDIYLNGNSDIDNPDIPDLAYRFATPFVELPAGATQVHIVVDGGSGQRRLLDIGVATRQEAAKRERNCCASHAGCELPDL